jgi:hypothetical protein
VNNVHWDGVARQASTVHITSPTDYKTDFHFLFWCETLKRCRARCLTHCVRPLAAPIQHAFLCRPFAQYHHREVWHPERLLQSARRRVVRFRFIVSSSSVHSSSLSSSFTAQFYLSFPQFLSYISSIRLLSHPAYTLRRSSHNKEKNVLYLLGTRSHSQAGRH